MKRIIIVITTCLAFASCNVLDTAFDINTTQEQLDGQPSMVLKVGYAPYGYMVSGFSDFDNNLGSARCDEAVATSRSASVRYFNNGSWNAYNNPDNRYASFYKGIRAANYYLEYSVEYKKMLAVARDTLSDNGTAYHLDVINAGYLRAEARVLKAYYYFELLKRYGDVPLYKSVPADATFLPRAPYAEVVEYAIKEIDDALPSLAPDWKSYASFDGRFNKGAALALKSRILLYAASPLNTEDMSDAERTSAWERAADAASDVIALGQYQLSDSYKNLFVGNTSSNKEIILSKRSSPSNNLEKANYPIATAGGNSGITPSGNLVDAYEYTGTPDPASPFVNRDPRLAFTIVTNGSTWNSRTIDISENGTDSYRNTNASRTGYYLRKYLTDDLVLTQSQTAMHHWVYFRYAEILLNYAEAANEVWGPDVAGTCGLTAREALNMVRNRPSVALGDIDLSKFVGIDERTRMRAAVKAERRVELAFEDHRYWDLLRWKDGASLAETITGIKASVNGDKIKYEKIDVEPRVFEENMYRYPLPHEEVSKAGGVLVQNEGWN